MAFLFYVAGSGGFRRGLQAVRLKRRIGRSPGEIAPKSTAEQMRGILGEKAGRTRQGFTWLEAGEFGEKRTIHEEPPPLIDIFGFGPLHIVSFY